MTEEMVLQYVSVSVQRGGKQIAAVLLGRRYVELVKAGRQRWHRLTYTNPVLLSRHTLLRLRCVRQWPMVGKIPVRR